MLPPDDSPPPTDDADGPASPLDIGVVSRPADADALSTDATVIGALAAPATIDGVIAMLTDLRRALRVLKGRTAQPPK